jgi:hypothetical protein
MKLPEQPQFTQERFLHSLYDLIPRICKAFNRLADSGGSALLGFLQSGTGAVARTAQDKMREAVSIEDFGAVLDGTTDDGPAVNLAIKYVFYTLGGGVVRFPTGCAIEITTKVLLPSGVFLDLNGARIVGGGIGHGTPMFESAYDNAGTITSNIGTASATEPVLDSGVIGRGATITNAGTVFNLYNWIDNCIVEGIKFNDCTKPVFADECFYSTFRRLFSRGTASATAEPAFHFETFNNVITLETIYVVGRTLAMKIDGGSYGLKISNFSAEGCTTGIQFRSTINSLMVNTCYFESTTTALDFGGGSPSFVGIDIDGCWFNLCTTALTGTAMQGRWGSGNVRNTGDNAVDLSDISNLMNVELPYSDNSSNATPALPADFTVGRKCRVEGIFGLYDSGTGFPSLKTFHQTDVVPFAHHGDSGTPAANVVGFHSHAKTAGTTFDVEITTTIVYQASAHVVYWLDIADNVSGYQMFGRVVNGTTVKADDASGKTVTASNSGGFLKLTATSFSHPGSTYTCKGVVRHA